KTIDNGIIRIESGKITYIGRRLNIPSTALQMDATDKFITPGFIVAHSTIGLSADHFTADSTQDLVTPGYRVIDHLDLADPGFAEASLHGITTVNIMPYSKRPIAGVGVLIKTDGTRFWDRVIDRTSALSIFLIQDQVTSVVERERSLASEVEAILEIRTNLQRALELKQSRDNIAGTPSDEGISGHLEVLLNALNQEIPVMIYARTPTEIERGISLYEDFDLHPIFVNMGLVDQLVERFVGQAIDFIPGPVEQAASQQWMAPVEFGLIGDLFRQKFRTQILVNDFGVEGSGGIRNLLYQAAVLQRLGVSSEEALRSITVYPAEMLGVDDRLGTIEVGKDADLNIFSAPPLEMQTVPDIVIINGEVVTEARR
ncbi:MAG TPA: amidohydrolase family protein, partial [bacterium]|nr:amidohydrolase family protein [bacterium]